MPDDMRWRIREKVDAVKRRCVVGELLRGFRTGVDVGPGTAGQFFLGPGASPKTTRYVPSTPPAAEATPALMPQDVSSPQQQSPDWRRA